MPNPADDDLEKWGYSFHTKVKHQILSQYIGPWSSILGRWHKSVTYVDGFAGRGRYKAGEPGSPLLVIDAAINRMNRYPGSPDQVICHFVEANAANFRNLRDELHTYGPARDTRLKIFLHNGPFAREAPSIIADLAASKQPSFFFVDPFGFDDTPMTSLAPIIQLDRSELFINLMTSFIVRAFGRLEPGMAHTLDALFGSSAWRAIATSNSTGRDKQLAEIYGLGLKSLGINYTVPFPVGDEEEDRTIYTLIHATKHPKGARIMKDEMIKVSTPGKVAFTFEATKGLKLLFHYDLDRLPDLLMARFKGQTVTFEDAVYQTLEESGACKFEDYRQTIKQMIEAGRARKIAADPRSKATSLDDKDGVEFLR